MLTTNYYNQWHINSLTEMKWISVRVSDGLRVWSTIDKTASVIIEMCMKQISIVSFICRNLLHIMAIYYIIWHLYIVKQCQFIGNNKMTPRTSDQINFNANRGKYYVWPYICNGTINIALVSFSLLYKQVNNIENCIIYYTQTDI